MNPIRYTLKELKEKTVPIGREGENEYTVVAIDCAEVYAEHPDAVASMKVQNPNKTIYPAAIERSGDDIIWTVKASDLTVKGDGRFQLTFTEGTVIHKTVIGRTLILKSLLEEGPVPEQVADWIDEATELMEDMEEKRDSGYFKGDPGEPGEPGAPGAPGHSPVLTASKSGKVTTIYSDGTQLAQISDGQDGQGADVIDDTAPALDKTFSSSKVDGELGQLKNAITAMNPAATASDIGKALIVKTVADGKPATWEYGEAGGGSVDPQDIEDACDAWLSENITNPDSPPLDRSLSSDSAATPADMVGDIEKFKGHTMLTGTYSGTRYLQVEKTIPVGKYHVHVDNITSTDTDKTTCRFTFSNSGGELIVEQFNRGTVIDIDITLESEATKVVMYASSIYAYTTGDTFTFTNLIITKRYDLLDKINDMTGDIIDLNAKLPVFSDYEIKTAKVLDSFAPNHKSYTFATGANISNYATYGETNDVYSNTPPVKIRNKNGKLIYNNIHLTPKTADTPALWTFDINGEYLRSVTFTGMGNRATTFLSDEYYAIFNEFPTVSGYTDIHWLVSNIDIEWLNGKNEYTVGTGGDFATFTSMLIALANDKREKTVYIKGGTYDIFEEMGGAEYIASIAPDVADLNWKDVCHVVPPNTKIIGLGNVILSWLPTAQQMISEPVAFLFSPLNIMGNCHIENISVVAQNCRYTVHDESSGLPENDGAKHYYKNCRFTLLPGSYGFILYGAGHNRLMDVRFDDCVFDSQNSSMIWSTHDWTTDANDNSVFTFNNCVFTSAQSDPHVRFSSGDTVGRLDKVMFNNCYLQKVKFVSKINGNVKQGYDVQLIGCTPVVVEYDERVTDRVAVRQYNPIPQSN